MRVHPVSKGFERRPASEQTGDIHVDILTLGRDSGAGGVQQVESGDARLRRRRHPHRHPAEVRRRESLVVVHLKMVVIWRCGKMSLAPLHGGPKDSGIDAWSTGPLARPFARGKGNFVMSQNDLVLSHSALVLERDEVWKARSREGERAAGLDAATGANNTALQVR